MEPTAVPICGPEKQHKTHEGPGGGDPRVLVGHATKVQYVAISPDLRWVASTSEDDTLRLWPMPDLDEPPLHTLPYDQLLAKLRSLTNLRAVRDPESSTGWTVELGPFPGWKNVPTWCGRPLAPNLERRTPCSNKRAHRDSQLGHGGVTGS